MKPTIVFNRWNRLAARSLLVFTLASVLTTAAQGQPLPAGQQTVCFCILIANLNLNPLTFNL
jgi:hypothetical protein